MDIKKWYEKRGLRFVIQRTLALLDRYRITPSVAMARIDDTTKTLAKYGCAPTFFTPGTVANQYSRFIQGLQANGAEIAVHSYQHIDLGLLTLAKANEQLSRAVETFNKNGIGTYGFRCPYLSCSDDLLESLPEELFGYSSNRAIWLDPHIPDITKGQGVFSSTLHRFYHPMSADENISMPWARTNLLEIPVCVPDDLMLHDGLNLNSEGISHAWIGMLCQIHQRGELFNLIFHPELGSICRNSFEDLLQYAILLKPSVWIARLREIAEWWREKSSFGVEITPTSAKLKLKFSCTPRATILVRGLDIFESPQVWAGKYHRVITKNLELPSEPLPFVGLASDIPENIATFLREQGYILVSGEEGSRCSIYIDAALLARTSDRIQLINFIEESTSPLIRYWRWPDGAKCAMSITGDLDALSLIDYVRRLIEI